MTTQDAFERTLALLYEAALTAGKWAPAAASLDDAIRANGHSLSYVDMNSPKDPEVYLSRFFIGGERREDEEELYFRDYFWRDEAIPRLHGLGDGEVAHRSDLYTDREKKTSIVYNEFRCARGTEDGLYLGLDGRTGVRSSCPWATPPSVEAGGTIRSGRSGASRLTCVSSRASGTRWPTPAR